MAIPRQDPEFMDGIEAIEAAARAQVAKDAPPSVPLGGGLTLGAVLAHQQAANAQRIPLPGVSTRPPEELVAAFELESPSCDEIRSQEYAHEMEVLENKAIAVRHAHPDSAPAEQASRRAFLATRGAQNVVVWTNEGRVGPIEPWRSHLGAAGMHERARDAAANPQLKVIHATMAWRHQVLALKYSNEALAAEVGPDLMGKLREDGRKGTHEILQFARITAEEHGGGQIGQEARFAVTEGEKALQTSLDAMKGLKTHAHACFAHEAAMDLHKLTVTLLEKQGGGDPQRAAQIAAHRVYQEHHAYMADLQQDLATEKEGFPSRHEP